MDKKSTEQPNLKKIQIKGTSKLNLTRMAQRSIKYKTVARALGNNLSEESSNQTDTDVVGDVTNTTRTEKQ